jgi:hypothetical protein
MIDPAGPTGALAQEETDMITGTLVNERYDDFFKWIPEDCYRAQTDPGDASTTGLVEVDGDLIAAFKADMLPPGPHPAPGLYMIHWNSDGVLHAYAYGQDEDRALREVMPIIEASLEGEDPIDLESERPAPVIEVISVHKPQRVVATAEAVLRVEGSATVDEVVDAGLAALHESRTSLFGYGIRDVLAGESIVNRTVTVYANRD